MTRSSVYVVWKHATAVGAVYGVRKTIYKAAERFKEVVLHGALTYNLVRPTHLEHRLEKLNSSA